MTKYRVSVKFTKIAIPSIAEFDNESLAKQYKEMIEQNRNVRWVSQEVIKP